MTIYEAAVAMGSAFGSITAPQAPDEIRVLPPGHEDDRHAKRAANVWINIGFDDQAHEDEVNSSSIYKYGLTFSAWYAKGQRSLPEMAQGIGTLAHSCVTALLHTTLGGFARKGITAEDITLRYETGDKTDLAYVIRGVVTVERQQ